MFPCWGFVCYCGQMGAGKTLSMVREVDYILSNFPKCLLVTNIRLNTFPYDGKRVFKYHNFEDLYKFDNGDDGIIYMIDELQVEANNIDKLSSSDSKLLNRYLTQLRSKHVLIMSTSPNFSRIAKIFRENYFAIVICHQAFYGLAQRNLTIQRADMSDRSILEECIEIEKGHYNFFFRTKKLYSLYNTFACQGV